MVWFIIRQLLLLVILSGVWLWALDFMRAEYRETLKKPMPHISYVDAYSAMTEQTGAPLYPFHSIATALEHAATNDINLIIINRGIYHEQLILPENITLFGNGTVKIVRDTKAPGPTVTLANNTTLFNLHLEGGRDTLSIPAEISTSVIHSTISHADRYGVHMKKKERQEVEPQLDDAPALPFYEILERTEEEIAALPLVTFRQIIVMQNDNQGMYLRDGRILLTDSKIINNGEEGIDLHPHMHATIRNTIAQFNGESGLETEIYDNTVLLEGNTFDHNVKNGIGLITSLGIGDIMIINNTITNNKKFGIRCAIHKNKPKKPRPFFRSLVLRENNVIENNAYQVAQECYTF